MICRNRLEVPEAYGFWLIWTIGAAYREKFPDDRDKNLFSAINLLISEKTLDNISGINHNLFDHPSFQNIIADVHTVAGSVDVMVNELSLA